jgi:hypothetical protein
MRCLPARSGHASVSNAEPDPVAVLLARLKKRASDPLADQKSQGTWKAILGWAVGIGVVLLAVLTAVKVPLYGDLGPSPGSGDSRNDSQVVSKPEPRPPEDRSGLLVRTLSSFQNAVERLSALASGDLCALPPLQIFGVVSMSAIEV